MSEQEARQDPESEHANPIGFRAEKANLFSPTIASLFFPFTCLNVSHERHVRPFYLGNNVFNVTNQE
jgi:hypothetical protein